MDIKDIAGLPWRSTANVGVRADASTCVNDDGTLYLRLAFGALTLYYRRVASGKWVTEPDGHQAQDMDMLVDPPVGFPE